MDSQFGEAFLFLTNLAYKCRITLPILVTAVFMVMDIRLQIEINIQTGQMAADFEDDDNGSVNDDDEDDDDAEMGSQFSQESWETLYSDEENDEAIE